MAQDKYFTQLDNLLLKGQSGILELKINADHSERDMFAYLENEQLIKKYDDAKFRLTMKGRLFIDRSGFSGEIKRRRLQNGLKTGFWIANILSLIVAVVTLRQSSMNSLHGKCTKEKCFYQEWISEH